MSFIYCVDEQTKNNLTSKGYRLLKQESIQNQNVWIFEYKPEIQFDIADKNQYYISDVFRF